MHDFCFTIPYGMMLVLGGIIGFVKKGSMASLCGGSGIGLLLILAGYLSLRAFEKRNNSYFAWFLETACAIAVTIFMGQRYLQTSKIMPAGIVAGISGVMTIFYVYKLATGGDTIVEQREELMISPTGDGKPILRSAHFLKPTVTSIAYTPCFEIGEWPLNVYFDGWRCPQKNWKLWVDSLRYK